MRADRLKGRIEPNKPLILHPPSDAPPGDVDVILLYASETNAPAPYASLAEFHTWLRQQPPSGRAREDIDHELATERDAWE
jgi:hypothetical protein